MTRSEMLEKRKKMLDAIEAETAKQTKVWNEVAKQYLKEHCPVERSKVYEVVKDFIKRRGFKRFVIYNIDFAFFSVAEGNFDFFIRAGGWWLDENNVPKKWDTMTVGGDVGNPTILKLSENQEHQPHPDKKRLLPEYQSS